MINDYIAALSPGKNYEDCRIGYLLTVLLILNLVVSYSYQLFFVLSVVPFAAKLLFFSIVQLAFASVLLLTVSSLSRYYYNYTCLNMLLKALETSTNFRLTGCFLVFTSFGCSGDLQIDGTQAQRYP